jgi:hypothetical protein
MSCSNRDTRDEQITALTARLTKAEAENTEEDAYEARMEAREDRRRDGWE